MSFLKIKLNKKGQAALFVAVSISAFLLYVSLYTMNRNIEERKALREAQNSVESFYLADTGIERFLFILKTQLDDGSYVSMSSIADSFGGDADTNNGIGIVGLADNGYKIVVTGNVIKVIGNYRNVNRAIELSYSAP